MVGRSVAGLTFTVNAEPASAAKTGHSESSTRPFAALTDPPTCLSRMTWPARGSRIAYPSESSGNMCSGHEGEANTP